MQKRETLASRLGFIMLSAGCAIGIGNVWKFPYITGLYGGGIFVLIYIFFLLILGIPLLTIEFAVGRASRTSPINECRVLAPQGTRWHWRGIFSFIGAYLLMMYYTTVSGWMLHYFYLMSTGAFTGASPDQIGAMFGGMLSTPGSMVFWMAVITIAGFAGCSIGLQKGAEKITKVVMTTLLVLIVALAIKSIMLPGSMAGLKFYLLPDINRLIQNGVANTIIAAMNQAFFTLSLGIGCMSIFGSYIGKEHTLLNESIWVTILDTGVALAAGLVVFPVCFAFNLNPDSGPSLIFITLPNIFNHMAGGRLWGSLFFLFMAFAAFSTVLAVFENILSCCMELTGWSRKKTAGINAAVMIILSLPCTFGFNLLSGIQPLGAGSTIMDLEDLIVSNFMLPLGSLIYLLFCTSRKGWGWNNFIQEANTGKGFKVPNLLRFYMSYILPLIILCIFFIGLKATLFK